MLVQLKKWSQLCCGRGADLLYLGAGVLNLCRFQETLRPLTHFGAKCVPEQNVVQLSVLLSF